MILYNASLINSPIDDPGVYLEFKHRRQAVLFDLGDLHALAPRKILKIEYIFVSHTHMDHFVGFDHLVRLCLGRNRRIAIFGPAGFIGNVEHRLQSYTWNLVNEYTNDFALTVTEIDGNNRLQTAVFQCRTGFLREPQPGGNSFHGILMENSQFYVKAACLDHKIPCLAFCFEEHERLNIKKNALQDMGLPTGPWLNDLKDYILRGSGDDEACRVWWKAGDGRVVERFIPLGTLKERVVKMTSGHRIAYVTDVLYSAENIRKIVELVEGAEILFIEGTFLQEDHEKAARKYHLTAEQAGTIARMAGVKRLVLFHMSPKYKGSEELLIREAMEAFTFH
ncbi:MAG: Ribonuclease Z [Syntrophus sp. SKADARSKE-3]|nr:Ribonuclease Z [Syntrophus sp. SKADARSKE-3]